MVVKVAKLPNQEDYVLAVRTRDNGVAEVEDRVAEMVNVTGHAMVVVFGTEEDVAVHNANYVEVKH